LASYIIFLFFTGRLGSLALGSFLLLLSPYPLFPCVLCHHYPTPSHSKSLAPEWKKAATALKGLVKVGAVDMDVHAAVGQPYNVRGFPTIKIFGANKGSPSSYEGARTAQAIVDAAIKEVSSAAKARLSGKKAGASTKSDKGSGSKKGSGSGSAVIQLTEANFDEKVMNSDEAWLVEFFAPWCGHCKSLAPEWEKAAKRLHGKVNVAAVDATVHGGLASRFNIRGYPTIKVFKAGVKGQPEDYQGGRTADAIVSFASSLAAPPAQPKPVHQLTSSEVFNEECASSSLCMVAFLPHILDSQAEGRRQYLSVLDSVSKTFRNKPFRAVWAQAGQQTALMEALEMGGSGFPAVAVLSAKKSRFVPYLGVFDAEHLDAWVKDIFSGRVKTLSLGSGNGPFNVNIDNVQPWDGKDAQIPQDHDEL